MMGYEEFFLILTALIAGAGAWFGAYLREKGKNLATQEDVQKLTLLTEEVKVEVLGKSWLEQKRWDLKRDYYWSLLNVVTDVSKTLGDLKTVNLKGKNTEELTLAKKQVDSLAQEMRERGQLLDRSLNIGRIILPKNITAILDNFENRLNEITKDAAKTIVYKTLSEDELKALSEVARQEYYARIDEFPKYMNQYTEKLIKELKLITKEIVIAARHDLLSLKEAEAE